jgi:dihydrofolate reductase
VLIDGVLVERVDLRRVDRSPRGTDLPATASSFAGVRPARPGGYVLGRRAYEIFAPYWPKAPEEKQIIAEPQLEHFDRETV